jgi:hypothetical protein
MSNRAPRRGPGPVTGRENFPVPWKIRALQPKIGPPQGLLRYLGAIIGSWEKLNATCWINSLEHLQTGPARSPWYQADSAR